MTKVTILRWQEIPAVVEARGPDGKHKVQLSQRFQELIDLIAMKKKLAGTDEYLTQWGKDQPVQREEGAEAAAQVVAAEIEARYDTIKAEALAKC